ncbi:MAG: flagellar export chaperone FliS [Actinomycetota bacterium]
MTFHRRAALADQYQNDGMAASSPPRLLLAVFDRLQRDLNTAIAAISMGQVEPAHRALVNAQDLVLELRLALEDQTWSGASELQALYDYVIDRLVEANLSKDPRLVQDCLAIVVPLAETWVEADRMLRESSAVDA